MCTIQSLMSPALFSSRPDVGFHFIAFIYFNCFNHMYHISVNIWWKGRCYIWQKGRCYIWLGPCSVLTDLWIPPEERKLEENINRFLWRIIWYFFVGSIKFFLIICNLRWGPCDDSLLNNTLITITSKELLNHSL